ncbi:uncharacterized protein LOC113747159 [Larimichthys crocea]|uniref:uncharacterized protein LOC113747159 n=1 Tax=Larimichthys crocea TaxID=215358 RepID=UPI000F5E60AE|nr:uncharacterized protein LOC113747159 [Larimichthys crocea]XP_027141604.1 uncharacterized protein LOC113747159 [Larimichthys crocea]XP_027141605.1 uncharacterized protein LOC113747159 [Larimichthys crocea]XP_027141606.1 uncharacterized protein LOC113747159 [Larimichthys crocea]
MDVNVKQEIIVTLEKKLDMTQKNYAIKLNELKIKLEKAGDKSSSAQDEMVTEFCKKQKPKNTEMLQRIQLQNLCIEYNGLCCSYDMLCKEKASLKEESDKEIAMLKKDLKTIVEDKNGKILKLEEQVKNMFSALQKILNDTNLTKQHVSERDMELEGLKIQLHGQKSQNGQLVAQFQAEKELKRVLHSELVNLKNQVHQMEEPLCLSQDLERLNKSSLSDSQDSVYEECVTQNPELEVEDSPSVSQGVDPNAGATGGGENAAMTTKKHSLWKRTRHFLGLRKKNKVEKVNQQTESPSVVEESSIVSQDSVYEECVSQNPELEVEESPSVSQGVDPNARATDGGENAAMTTKKHSV